MYPSSRGTISSDQPATDRNMFSCRRQTMLRIYFMQQWYGLSDPAMEDSLYDVASMRRFAGAALDAIPDETTICKFRHFLERHQ